MIPDVGAGTPWTALWFIAALFLLALTLISGVTLTIFNRALQKRDTADDERDGKISKLEEQIRTVQIEGLRRNNEHQERIHKLQINMMECRTQQCTIQGNLITREEHHGDQLRLQDVIKASNAEVMGAINVLHRRIDTYFGNTEAKTK
jgi:TolA-binding protein